MLISGQHTMMIEPAFSLDEACRQAQDMINQMSRHPRDAQGQSQSALDIPLDHLPRSAVISHKKDQSYSKQSIHSKLTKLYFEELSQSPHATQESVLNNLENECDLLGRLVQKEGLQTLIVNLYTGNKGYSLAVRNSLCKGMQYDKNTSISETQLMGYEQGELLTCIDNNQLPATLAEQLEANHSHLFYDGCIIAEIRDYRKVQSHNKPEIHHVLLKPTTQSILSDVSTLTSDGDWSHEERLQLESRLVEATQGPLCLDPNPIPSLVMTRMRQSKALFADHQLVRQAKKFSQVTVNRKRKLEQMAQPEGITIQDLMQRLKTKRGGSAGITVPPPAVISAPLLPPTTPVDVMRNEIPLSALDLEINSVRYAKAYEPPRETKDCLPLLIEEYILETERGQGRVYHIKLSILQRPSNSEYIGELYVDIDYREADHKGSSCRFTLGTRAQANQYIQQFTEIFTEEGRKNVKIQHVIPGQAPRITCTAGVIRPYHHQQQQQQQLQQQQVTNAQRVHHQVKAQLVAQQLQQAQSQRVAQQILSRAQTHLSQLNSFTQVANSIKAMTDAAASSSRQPTTLVNCLDNVTQSIPGIVQNDPVAINVEQALTCNTAASRVANSASLTGQVLDNASGSVTMATTDMAPCNGSTGILVFQQKPVPAPAPSSASSVPVLQAQLQAGTLSNLTDTSNHNDVALQNNSKNLAISALATSLMNSAQQFTQQQAAANAAAAAASMNNTAAQTVTKSNNAAILSLLNSSPANLTQQKNQSRRISLNASIPQRVLGHGNVITVPSTTGQVRVSFSPAITANQLSKTQPVKATAVRLARVQDPTSTLGLSMPGLSALLAGTPSEDNSVPGIAAASSLFERLTQNSNQNSQPASPMTSPPPVTPPTQPTQQQPTNVNLQGVNLASLPNSINGLQNVQVSIPGLSQPITMSLNVSAATGGNVVTPTGVIVSLPISSATNTCSTVSSMIPATVVTTAGAGTTPTVVIANPANAHLSLPIAQLIPSGVKGITQQNIRSNNAAVTLAQGGQAIQLVGSQRSRLGQMTRQIQSNQAKTLPNQLVAVSKTVAANQLVLSRNKQILTPIMVAASKPMLMATQTGASSSQSAISTPTNKQTLLAKSLHARSASAAAIGQCNTQAQALNAVAGLSQQQIQQLQQCLAAQQKATIANASVTGRTQIQPRGSTGGEDVL